MLDTYFITISTDMDLNIFLNGLHDCQRVMQKSIVTPQDTPPDTPQDDYTNYGIKKAPMSYL